MYIPSIQFKKKKIQSKQKSAKLKLNLINTTIAQNRIQEIVKINEKLGKKEEKMPTIIKYLQIYSKFHSQPPLQLIEQVIEKTKKPKNYNLIINFKK